MASKFAGLKELKDEKKGEGTSAPNSAPSGALLTPKERKLTGKRSDPNWKQHSVLVKNESFDEAREILKDKYNGRDFSELVQALLDQWLVAQRAS